MRSLHKLLFFVALMTLAITLLVACGVADPQDTTQPPQTTAQTTAPMTTATTTQMTTPPTVLTTTTPIISVPEVTTAVTTAVTTSALPSTVVSTATTSPVVTTAPIAEPENPELIFATLLDKQNDVVGIVLPNATESFSFREEITAPQGVSYTVSSDIYGQSTYASKSVPLSPGYNTFYIHVESADGYRMYTVELYRRPMHTVTFALGYGLAPITTQVEEGHIAVPPSDIPYAEELVEWLGGIDVIVTAPTTFNAKWREYTLTYENALTGATAVANPETYTVHGISLSPSACTGYSFEGWLLDGQTVFAIPSGTTGNKTLRAVWEHLLHPSLDGAALLTYSRTYNGSSAAGDAWLSISPYWLDVSFTYYRIDPVSGSVIADLGSLAPVDAGTYLVTPHLSYNTLASSYDRAFMLPQPQPARLVIYPATFTGNGLAATATELYYTANLSVPVAESTIVSGTLPAGIARTVQVAKLSGSNDASNGIPVAVPGYITAADGTGYYRVTVTYTELDGKDNYSGEANISHTALVYIREISKQVKRADSIKIDGVIDAAYLESASYTTCYQDSSVSNGKLTLLGDIVDPYTTAAHLKSYVGEKVGATTPATSATFYFLWGEEVEGDNVTPYIYVAIEVTDPSRFERSADYVAHPNPWINDNVELFYHLGGSSAPSLVGKSETYPTYNAVTRDSSTGNSLTGNMHSAVVAQRSYYFMDIVSATRGRELTGNNTYVIEYKIPAITESYYGTPGNANFTRSPGSELTAGDFIYFAYQLNDLTGLPAGYANTAAYDAYLPSGPKYTDEYSYHSPEGSTWAEFENRLTPYMACYGNRRPNYLSSAQGAPMVLQLSSEYVSLQENEVDAGDILK